MARINRDGRHVIESGWLRTGDLAKYDKDNDYYIVGRKKDIIISGGENIYPQEIEQCLIHFEDIKEVAVVGRKDDYGVKQSLHSLPWQMDAI